MDWIYSIASVLDIIIIAVFSIPVAGLFVAVAVEAFECFQLWRFRRRFLRRDKRRAEILDTVHLVYGPMLAEWQRNGGVFARKAKKRR